MALGGGKRPSYHEIEGQAEPEAEFPGADGVRQSTHSLTTRRTLSQIFALLRHSRYVLGIPR